MMISKEKPPNWDKLVELYKVEWGPTVVTWSPNVHCAWELTGDTLAHENVHIGQQDRIGVEEWWRRFYEDPAFRYEQELEAYRVQYQYLREHVKDRNKLNLEALRLASYLSGEMYDNIVTKEEALKAIKA